MGLNEHQESNQHRVLTQIGPSKSAGPLYDEFRTQSWTSNAPLSKTISILSPQVGFKYQLSFLHLSSYPPGFVKARILKNDVEAWPFYGSGVYHYEKGAASLPSFVTGDSCKINLVVDLNIDWTYNSYVGFYKIAL